MQIHQEIKITVIFQVVLDPSILSYLQDEFQLPGFVYVIHLRKLRQFIKKYFIAILTYLFNVTQRTREIR